MARSATILIEAEAGSALKQVETLEESLEDLEIAAVETRDGIDQLGGQASSSLSRTEQSAEEAATALKQTASAQDRVADSSVTMRSSVQASANNLGFELVQASQDARYGMAGVANQIPLMTEQFTQLQSKTGSTKGALAALAGSLTGPAGVIGAVTLLLSFAPDIISFFESWVSGAEETTEASKELRQETRSATQQIFDTLRDNSEVQNQALGVLRQAADTARQDYIQALGQSTEKAEQARKEWRRIQSTIEAIKNVAPEVEQNFLALTEAGLPTKLADELAKIAANAGDASTQTEQLAKSLREITQLDAAIQGVMRLEQTDQVLADPKQDRRARLDFAIQNQATLAGSRRELGKPRFALGEAVRAGQDAGFLPQMSNSLTDVLGKAGDNVKDGLNNQLARGVDLAAQIGTTLVESSKEGGASFKQVMSSIFQSVGSIIGMNNPVTGALFGGVGSIVSAFQSGGTVDTPLQIVGEEGPELAALPQGTRISDASSTRRMLQDLGTSISTISTPSSREFASRTKAVGDAQSEQAIAALRDAIDSQTRELREATERGLRLDPASLDATLQEERARKRAQGTELQADT